MRRTVSFGVHQMKVKPRPLVGNKTFIKETQREMRNREWSDNVGRPIIEALRDNMRESSKLR
jgi:hypothetical protein